VARTARPVPAAPVIPRVVLVTRAAEATTNRQTLRAPSKLIGRASPQLK
jgi:hypothetical protein